MPRNNVTAAAKPARLNPQRNADFGKTSPPSEKFKIPTTFSMGAGRVSFISGSESHKRVKSRKQNLKRLEEQRRTNDLRAVAARPCGQGPSSGYCSTNRPLMRLSSEPWSAVYGYNTKSRRGPPTRAHPGSRMLRRG